MKKLFAGLLAACMLLSITACGDEPVDDGPLTLEDVNGWYERYNTWEDSLPAEILNVDAATATVTGYDEYYNVVGVYDCRCDETGFSIDFDEPIGTETYVVMGSLILDGDDNALWCYFDKLGQDMKQSQTSFKLEDIVGVWYRDGKKDDVKLVVTDSVYYTEQDGKKGKEAPAEVLDQNGKSIGLDNYNGSVLVVDPFVGPFSFELWITEDGKVMYDDFERRFWVKEDVTGDELAQLIMKYDIIRDAWASTSDTSVIEFRFNGDVKTLKGDGSSSVEIIGSWKLVKDSIRIDFKDGTSETVKYGDEIKVAYTNKTYERHIEW